MDLTLTASQPVRANRARAGFFEHHGWLAPGIRLFRAIRFPAKSLWIGLSFALPLLFALLFLAHDARALIASAKSEHEGLRYIAPLTRFISLAQQARTEAAGGAAGHAAPLGGPLEALARLHGELGQRFRDGEAYAAFERSAQAVLALPRGAAPDEAFARYNTLLADAGHLVTKLCDGSELSLDPAPDTYNLINFALLRGTAMTEKVARIQAADRLLPAHDAALTRELLTGLGALQLLRSDLDNAHQEAVLANSSLAQRFERAAASQALDQLIGAVNRQAADGAASGALANAARLALQQQQALQERALTLLNDELALRIEGMERRLALQLTVSLLFVLLACYLMLCFYRVMLGGLNEVGRHLEEITRGNLTAAPVPWGDDEAASLMRTMGAMQQSLRNIAGTVLQGSGRIEAASREIASASQGLSQRTEQAASCLEETAASMEQLARTITSNAASIDAAVDIVRHNAEVARHGQQVMDRLQGNMDAMQAAAQQIASIITVIDGIAFQTNILALNAAVEAARAGEHGRGFAVVAAEVRQLAGRSATAAREVKELIQASIAQVEEGGKVAASAGDNMRQVGAGASQLNILMGEIAQATSEQRHGIGQVKSAVVELDGATQENAAMVEESSAAALAMSEDAGSLAEAARFFKLS